MGMKFLLVLGLVHCQEEHVCRHDKAVEETGYDKHGFSEPVDCPPSPTGKSGTISSPVIPGKDFYPNYCQCNFIIGADLAGEVATISINFIKMHLENKCDKDFIEISSRTSKLTEAPLCGNVLPKPIKRKVEFPVTITFQSDADFKDYEGFTLTFDIEQEFSSDSETNSEAIVSVQDQAEEAPQQVNVGLLVGGLVLIIIALVVAVVFYQRKNKKLETELNGPEPLEMSAFVMSAEENVYEDIGPDSNLGRSIIRTESQDSIAIEKERARLALLNESRPLPDTPGNNND